jgi:calcium-translocating P-type ATPase
MERKVIASSDAAGDRPGVIGAIEQIDPEERLDLLLRHLGTRRTGLRTREASRRLEQYGPNEIQRRDEQSHARDLARQFTHPLALLLWAAAGLAVAGGIAPLAIAIVVVIGLNAVFAFVQELQTERATEALQRYLPPLAKVRRDGEVREINAAELVPGDIILIQEGDRLLSDARLIDGSVEVDASPITGESQPVSRSVTRGAPSVSLLDAEDLVFSGTLCTAGEAEGVVFATGMHTELGRIAALTQRVQRELSPLQVRINNVAKLIALIAIAAGAIFLVLGITTAGLPVDDAVTFAIGLLVANVPEGLLPTITLALAVGVRRMARRRALVKRLTAVETLGSTDVICTDKTGTLTLGTMTARYVWADGREIDLAGHMPDQARAEPFSAIARTAIRCNNSRAELVEGEWERTGDPSESALVLAAAQLGEDVRAALAEREARRAAVFHFDPRLKRMTTLDVEPDGETWCHVKGAPLELLERCSAERTSRGDRPLRAEGRERVEQAFAAYARRGMRVLAFAERMAGPADKDERGTAESNLVFVGLMALEDPPRPEVAPAVATCRRAGIKVIVVTGDHALTAEAIARQVGIVQGEPRVITGPDLDALDEDELDHLLDSSPELIVARSNPETKLHLVDALRDQGHTVAMTGDGVNDSPALRRADIGVAMGATGTEVAREAATMVLTDDNFASIVAAIEEGRVVYENIRKFITYIFAHTTPEVIPFLIFALSGGSIPLPLTALQILAIDLGTETLPALALGREPGEPGVLDRAPRGRETSIIDRAMLTRAWLWLGLVEAALVTGGFFFVLGQAGWTPGAPTEAGTPLHDEYLAATTMTFAGITACQVGTAFAARTATASLREVGVFSNPLLLWGIGFELIFAGAIVYLPSFQDVFDTAALGLPELALLATFPLIVWGSDELRRWYARARQSRVQRAEGGQLG